jgi:hypothetical protein
MALNGEDIVVPRGWAINQERHYVLPLMHIVLKYLEIRHRLIYQPLPRHLMCPPLPHRLCYSGGL